MDAITIYNQKHPPIRQHKTISSEIYFMFRFLFGAVHLFQSAQRYSQWSWNGNNTQSYLFSNLYIVAQHFGAKKGPSQGNSSSKVNQNNAKQNKITTVGKDTEKKWHELNKLRCAHSSAHAIGTTIACQAACRQLILWNHIRAFQFGNDFSATLWLRSFSFFLRPCFISIYYIFNAMYLMFLIYWKQCVVGTHLRINPFSTLHKHTSVHHARIKKMSCSLWFPHYTHT